MAGGAIDVRYQRRKQFMIDTRAKRVLGIALIAMAISASQVLAQSPDHSNEIRVQVLDSRTHRPLKNHTVQLTFSGMDEKWDANAPTMTSKTGNDGVAVFVLKQPVLPLMIVFIRWTAPCSSSRTYSTKEILEDGVVGAWRTTGPKNADDWCTTDPQAPQAQKQPGTLVLPVHPMNRLVYLWYAFKES